MPVDLKKQYDVREVIARLVDGSEFDEFKALYGTTLVTGFAHIHGIPVGILGNNGILFSESALKAAHFHRAVLPAPHAAAVSAEHRRLHGRTRVRGRRHRQGRRQDGDRGRLRAGAEDHVVIGGSYGAGNYGMCGRAYGPRFLFTWPNARISVMGGEQAASVLATVRRDNIEAAGKTWSEVEEEEFKQPIREQYEAEGNPYYATARLWDDGIITPGGDAPGAGSVLSGSAECADPGDEVRGVSGCEDLSRILSRPSSDRRVSRLLPFLSRQLRHLSAAPR